MVKVILKLGRDESLRRFHPWVFSGAVAQVQGSPAEGDIVGVYSAEGQFLAAGHWQIGSIAVRVLSFDADPTAPEFWTDSIARAFAARQAVGLPAENTTCFRLIHGEGDGLPGLIIDWYDGVCVMQAHSVGMFRAKMQICEALQTVFGDRRRGRIWPSVWRTPSVTERSFWPPPPITPTFSPSCGNLSIISRSAAGKTAPWD